LFLTFIPSRLVIFISGIHGVLNLEQLFPPCLNGHKIGFYTLITGVYFMSVPSPLALQVNPNLDDLLPDLFDLFAEQLSLIDKPWINYGGKAIFAGEVVTVNCFEDNSKVKTELAKPGHGKVLVVDGQGSFSKALLGDLIAQSALDNGWEGIVICGCVRDAGAIAKMPLGVKALGTCPIKTQKRDLGEVNQPLSIAQVSVLPGMFIYADLNGIAVSANPLIDKA
jgi:regulator of ribonuclease activity A